MDSKLCVGVTTINTLLQMVCTVIDTLCKYIVNKLHYAKLEAELSVLLVGGRLRLPGDCS
jgi:hypothetical protein